MGNYPINVVRYYRNPQRHTLGRKHAFWSIDRPDRSRNKTWAPGEVSEKKKEERNETLRFDKSHIFAKTMHVALLRQSRHVGWGLGRSQPCQVSSRPVQGFRFP